MSTDLTVIVTGHDETAVCGRPCGRPTWRSRPPAHVATSSRRSSGWTPRPRPHPPTSTSGVSTTGSVASCTRAIGQGPQRPRPRLRRSLHRLPRRGRPLQRDWLAEAVTALDAAAERGVQAIAHPELMVVFDGAQSVMLNIDQTSPLFTPHYLYVRHYYDSLCLAPREAQLEIPYVTRDVPNGLSYQDFQWTIETLAAGWQHVVVKDTIIFKRRRDSLWSPRATPASRSFARYRRWPSTGSATWARLGGRPYAVRQRRQVGPERLLVWRPPRTGWKGRRGRFAVALC